MPPQWAGLKFFNVYGANESHKGPMQSMASKLCRRSRAGEPVYLFRSHDPRYRDGGQLRDFVYVKDCVAVVRWLWTTRTVNGLFNVGSGAARSFLDLVEIVGAQLGCRPDLRFVDTPEYLRAGNTSILPQADVEQAARHRLCRCVSFARGRHQGLSRRRCLISLAGIFGKPGPVDRL